MTEDKEGMRPELVTQQRWVNNKLSLKPDTNKRTRKLRAMAVRMLMRYSPVPDRNKQAKLYQELGLKRMVQLSKVLWVITAGMPEVFIPTKSLSVRSQASSAAELTRGLEMAMQAFSMGTPYGKKVEFMQQVVPARSFILNDGGSLAVLNNHLSFHALSLWILGTYAMLPEEQCDPQNYGYANVRQTKDMAWEWVQYLQDAIELAIVVA